MITKYLQVKLTQEEIESDEPIEIIVRIFSEDAEDEYIEYVISYPKEGQTNPDDH